MGRNRGWIVAAWRPVDASSIAAFRVIFGAIGLLLVVRYFAHDWIGSLYLRPTYFFSYPGLEWIRPWPGLGMYVHFAALGIAAAAVMLGFYTRCSAAIFCCLFTYAHLIDRTNYLNHYYLISLIAFLLSFLPSGSTASIDAWRGTGKAFVPNTVPAWSVWLLRFQLGVVYFYAGWAKLDPDWLFAAQPLRVWLAQRQNLAWIGPLIGNPVSPYVFSWAGALFDLTIPLFLLLPRTRRLAYIAVLLFHTMTAALFPTIGLFPWLMIGLTPIFFTHAWPRTLLELILPRSTCQASASTYSGGQLVQPATLPTQGWRRHMLVGAVLYASIQLVVPLRYLLEPSGVLWHERGFRFAWRVMLMEKHGATEFLVRDVATSREWRVHPHDSLTPLQVYMMSTQPDMIESFARHLAETYERLGSSPIEVRADARVSLNGRPHTPLVDPNCNLLLTSSRAWTTPPPS